MKTRLSLLLSLIVSLTATHPTNAASVEANSCSYRHVSTALNEAKAGDTLIIPAGNCNWRDHSLAVKKHINLQGMGRGKTTLKRTIKTTAPLIEVYCSVVKKPFSVSNITFSGLFDTSAKDRGLALVHGCQDFSVSESTFTGFAATGIDVTDHINNNPYQRGVIYKNRFIENFRVGLGYGVAVSAGGQNNLVIPYGSQNFVFIEDNFFAKNRHAIAANLDATYVLRHNQIQDNYPNYAAVDTHGKTTPDTDNRGGTKAVEIYANTIVQNDNINFRHPTPANPGYAAIGIRGGEALIYDNKISNYRFPIVLTVESATPCAQLTPPLVDKQATDVYIWNNRMSDNKGKSVTGASLGGNDNCENMFKLNQNYFYSRKPGYIAYPYPHPKRSDITNDFDILDMLPAIISAQRATKTKR